MYTISNFTHNDDVKVIEELGPFQVIEYQRDLSVMPHDACLLYTSKAEIGHIMTPVDCGHFGIDLIIPGINKAHGIQFLKERWQIKDGETMAFGDSGNDQEMLEEAEYSFAMANAKESVKEVSDYVIGSNNDQAVLDAIDWMIHKEKMFQK